ncbi:hypothetical protein ACLKA6_006129 [Drosophila palustris]
MPREEDATMQLGGDQGNKGRGNIRRQLVHRCWEQQQQQQQQQFASCFDLVNFNYNLRHAFALSLLYMYVLVSSTRSQPLGKSLA